jgi:hypothetical protein
MIIKIPLYYTYIVVYLIQYIVVYEIQLTDYEGVYIQLKVRFFTM